MYRRDTQPMSGHNQTIQMSNCYKVLLFDLCVFVCLFVKKKKKKTFDTTCVIFIIFCDVTCMFTFEKVVLVF